LTSTKVGTFVHLALWYNVLLLLHHQSLTVPIIMNYTIELGGSQFPELKKKNVYILRHSGLDPKLCSGWTLLGILAVLF